MRKLLVSLLLLFAVLTVNADVDKDQIEAKECARLEVCFSPFERCEEVVKLQLASADKTIDLALYSLTKDDIAEAIIQASKRGVRVRMVIDKAQAGGKYADDEKLEEVGIVVKRMGGMRGGLMHHKFAIIDGKTLLTGSYNWTKGGSLKNSENLLVLDSMIEEFQIEFNKLWTRSERKRKKKK